MSIAILGVLVLILGYVLAGLDKRTPDTKDLRAASWLTRVLGFVMIVGGVLWGAVVMVPAGYRGVLMQFQAVKGTLGEGIHLIMPMVNTVEMMEVRTQKEESKATAASRDLQIVTTSLALNFHVDPSRVGDLYRRVGKEYKARIIDPAVQESLKVVTAQFTAEELIKSRAQVKQMVEEDITQRLATYALIVEPAGLSITNFDFSPEFNKAIEEKQVAQQQAEKQKYVLQQAELERQTQVARAKGAAEAARLNAAALQVQGGNLVIMREWIEKWDGRMPQVSAGSGQNFMIDLSSLNR